MANIQLNVYFNNKIPVSGMRIQHSIHLKQEREDTKNVFMHTYETRFLIVYDSFY